MKGILGPEAASEMSMEMEKRKNAAGLILSCDALMQVERTGLEPVTSRV